MIILLYFGLLLFVILMMVIYKLLIDQDEKKQYLFEDLDMQIDDTRGERLNYKFEYYRWQHHKKKTIQFYCVIGNIICDANYYQIEEVRGPYRSGQALFQFEFIVYVNEKKEMSLFEIEGNEIAVFNDETLFFDVSSYTNDIDRMRKVINETVVDEPTRKSAIDLLNELRDMTGTRVLPMDKLNRYLGIIAIYVQIEHEKEQLEAIVFIFKLVQYLQKAGIMKKKEQSIQNINNFHAEANGIQIYQGGGNSTQIQTVEIQETIDYQKVLNIINEINKYEASFESVYKTNVDHVRKILLEVSELTQQRREPERIRKGLLELKNFTVGIAGSLIASGILGLLNSLGL